MLTAKKLNLALFVACATLLLGCGSNNGDRAHVPGDVQAIFNKPAYKNATWGLQVADLDTEKRLINLNSNHSFLIGSVRKVFTVGELMNVIGPASQHNTPVYRTGQIDSLGVLQGDLILVASGDLTMGGRTNPDGSIAISNFDHNDANSLGNAILTAPNPLAGYVQLAQQVAQSGVKRVAGNVIIDDRLFQPYNYRNEFNLRPIFVNDDVVDVITNPTTPGSLASVAYRPISSALTVNSSLVTGASNSPNTFALNPNPPQVVQCIGQPGCSAAVTGQLPINFIPPLTSQFPYVQTFRITEPSNYARTVFIEALEAAGVVVDAPTVAANPVQLLPAKDSYPLNNKVAELQGLPYSDDAKLTMKVSYNLGADTALILFGLTQGVDNMEDALKVEQRNLVTNYGISPDQYNFIDGSGGGVTSATNQAVVQFLIKMRQSPVFPTYFDTFPILAVDGSLGFAKNFQADPTLAGATGQVHAKTGTFINGSETALILRTQALGGYITTKKGRRLAFQLVVNNVPVTDLNDVIQTIQDQATITAILWRDY